MDERGGGRGSKGGRSRGRRSRGGRSRGRMSRGGRRAGKESLLLTGVAYWTRKLTKKGERAMRWVNTASQVF
jgi:hypothetical protein